uniref:Nudix hydrolase domain-containing protein n=1 Tax=Kwoniella pini CBS 10737 TaxID=1296096 RepID=A0A1B9HV55_9TREE|nr:uncharacterized protein I206_06930 [Kwoniella pini CBS 10737]OCF47152.1 hypothetical protein I206_06930 [Kwoniella pini CBS 10737]
MRTYAHDTALPGGKYEEGDIDAEGTARREAYEEIGLPIDHEKVKKLCELEKFITGNSLIVTPVIFIITDHTLTPLLNPEEVKRLFSMPLNSFLFSRPSKIPSFHYNISHRISSIPNWVIDSIPPPPIVNYSLDKGQVGGKEGRFYGFRDIIWGNTLSSSNSSINNYLSFENTELKDNESQGQGKVRMHRFLTGREGQGVKPVYGLTAAILIQTASIGYDQFPDFPFHAPGQKSMTERILYEIRHVEGPLRRAVEVEGLWDDWKSEEGHDDQQKKAKL